MTDTGFFYSATFKWILIINHFVQESDIMGHDLALA